MKNHITIGKHPKRDWLEENEPKKLSRTEADWDKDEASERNRPSQEDAISELVGVPIYYANYTNFDWKHSAQAMPITVSRFYPHQNLVVDEVPSAEELEPRISLFKRLGIKYMYINVGESLTEEQFMERLTQVRREHDA